MFINGYKFTTEQDAIDAVSRVDARYGIPNSQDNVTTHWCSYEVAKDDNPIFYYIIADETLISVLGYPSPIDVFVPEYPQN